MSQKEIGPEIREEFQRELKSLLGELTQIRSLVQDAIVKLSDSFSGLREQSNTQWSLVSQLISSMETGKQDVEKGRTGINIRQFVSETDQILRSFVDHIILVSRQSMEMVHRVDDLATQMNQVMGLVKGTKSIADQTNVLALNARIVAARAGDAGRAFAVVADEVRKLSKQSHEVSDKIDSVVEGATDNIDSAKKIIEAMASKDMSFAIQSKGRVDDMMQEISEIDRFTAITLSEVSKITGGINHAVGLAIMSLQFEDMVTQLAQAMEKKFALLDGFVADLCCTHLGDNGTPEEQIQHLRRALMAQKERFDAADRQAVHQTSMDEGDIEFF